MAMESSGIALRQHATAGLAHPADCIHRLRPLCDDDVAELDQLHERVVLVIAERHGMEELAGRPGDVRDHLRVLPVVLLRAFPDGAELAGVPHDGVAAAVLGERADPPAMRPGLHRDRRAHMLLEERSERFLVVVQFALIPD